jgi:hypothetical protein
MSKDVVSITLVATLVDGRMVMFPVKDKGRFKTKTPAFAAGVFSYLVFMHFEMRSSSFRNSAVSSSSFGLEGGLWRGNTSDIGLSLCPRPRCTSFSPAIAAFLRRALF